MLPKYLLELFAKGRISREAEFGRSPDLLNQ
jgi:hypothetical protein